MSSLPRTASAVKFTNIKYDIERACGAVSASETTQWDQSPVETRQSTKL
ncbi:hypothetical protein RSSM_05448 [Rhodopirellula sallentina SM41]|uniref:Uncharacterized protein n=1 Tax=Rhodopirellula sallentina SM41 TaxID=1263870 RepID=M5TVB7_9BACT|nr:hypothetical protein RSSM_05448 [Rhodopirellula sallentina SM41]